MLKLLKYELKGRYKLFLSMILIGLVLSIVFTYFEYMGVNGGIVEGINFVIGCITLVTVIKLWENEMYQY